MRLMQLRTNCVGKALVVVLVLILIPIINLYQLVHALAFDPIEFPVVGSEHRKNLDRTN
jgi:hypothetical protein